MRSFERATSNDPLPREITEAEHVSPRGIWTGVGSLLRRLAARPPHWAWDILAAALVALIAVPSAGNKTDWRFYDEGQRLLFGSDGLDLYASHPIIQIGPIALAVARAITLLPGDAQSTAVALTAALLAPCLTVVRRIVERGFAAQTSPATYITGWTLATMAWFPLAIAAQFGDALALLGALGAILSLLRSAGDSAAVLLSLGIGAKPWTAVLLPLLLFAQHSSRRRAAVVGATVLLVIFSPFLLASATTLHAAQPTFEVPGSDWQRLLGVGAVAPGWWRPAQVAVCWIAILVVLVKTRTAPGRNNPLLTAAALAAMLRLITDLGTWPYYTSVSLPLVLAADLGTRKRFPTATLLTFASLLSVGALAGDAVGTAYRLVCLVAALSLLTASLRETAESGDA